MDEPELKIRVFPVSDSWYASQVYAGLFDLAHDGRIDLEFTADPLVQISERDWGHSNNESIAYLEIHRAGHDPITACYDFLDGPEIITLDGLEQCDVYFKRSFDGEFLRNQPDEWHEAGLHWADKVLPYGLNCPCDSDYEFAQTKRRLIFERTTGDFWRSLGPTWKARIKDPVTWARTVASRVLRGNESKRTPMVEIQPAEPAEELILFQTRLFIPSANKHFAWEAQELNDYRIETLRQVKKQFGDRLIGGFIPDAYSQEQCPDLLTNHRFTRKVYFDLVRRCKVAMFTRGLRQSTGWRFPEFFAASRALVSEPLAYDLPTPLIDGENYLLFNSAEQAVACCDRLLSDAGFAQQMREANFEYYRNHIKPSSLVMNTIRAACSYVEEKGAR